MSELDKGALEAAAKALYTTWIDGPGAACMEPWSDDEDDEPDWQSVARNDAITSITAYLAVRPTPDAEAMERAFREALNDLIDAAHDEGRAQERGYATTGERGAAEAAVMALFRKAVRS